MRDRFRRLRPGSHFARRVSVLAGSTVGAQAVLIISSPILTRLYSPVDFGVLAVFMALLSTGTVVASLRYELAIVLPETHEEAARLLALCGAIAGSFALLTALVVIFFSDPIARLLGVPQLAPWLWLLPPALLFMALYQALHYFALRIDEYGAIARTRVGRSIGVVALQLGGFGLDGAGLVVGQAASGPIGVTSLGREVWRSQSSALKAVTGASLLVQARRYRDFPIWSAPGALMNVAASQMPTLALATLFSPSAAGLYALTHRVLSIPTAMIGQAVADVLFSRGAAAHREGVLAPLVAATFTRLVQIGLAPALILIGASPALFAFVFGGEWRSAGELASWLAILLFLIFVTSPLSRVFAITERQAELTLLQAGLLVMPAAALLLAYHFLGGRLIPVLAVYAAASSLTYALYLLRCLKIGGVSPKKAFAKVLGYFPAAFVIAAPGMIASWIGNDFLIIAGATGGLLVHGARLATVFLSHKGGVR